MINAHIMNPERGSGLRRLRARLFWIAALLGVTAATAQAQNTLEAIDYTALPGGKVEITLKFAEPVTDPRAFTTETPPTIALDLPDTRNGLTRRRIEIGTGATAGVSAVEAGGRTRVVVDLYRTSTYTTRINGNALVVAVNNGMAGATGVAATTAMVDPTKTSSAQQGAELTNVDFRRGKTGEGRLIVSFSQPGISADLKREGDRIVLNIANVRLGANQAQRLDVLDFATPVQSIETRSRGNGVRMEILATPPYEQMAYQTGTEYIVEIAPKREDPQGKGRNSEPNYSGERVTFNFQDIPARSVLNLLAEVSQVNIVVADTVQGNVTLRLINVPWDQALDLVLQAKGLDKRLQGNVIWVGPQEEIAKREQALADARLKREEQDELISDYIPVNYGKAKDIAELLTKDAQGAQGGGGAGAGGGGGKQRGFLSVRGSVTYDERTNTLLVSDIPLKVQEIRQLVAVLDRPVQQVLIESRIVIATDSFARELGARFGISGGYEDNHGNVITTAGSSAATNRMNNIALINRLNGGRGLPVVAPAPIPGGIAVPPLNERLNVNLPATTPAGSFGLAILGADYLLDLELSAAQTEGRGEVVSSPRVVTANQKEALIKQGQEVGYVTYQNSGAGGVGTATVQFKEAVLELRVTPTITADDRVYLNLNVKKDAIAGYIEVPGGGSVPQLDKREMNTGVLVDNGQTVVLGGVYEVEKRDDLTKVPLLGDVPILGNLFRKTGRTDTKAELLIFVTPKILNDSLK
ncbi:MAG TPA: type IV pilus secretin PilQ [Dokdonella sp.]|uniref:type IV pilus secretin PilQ n=1 Tax=Dokdonella sp. TaxID=2291710 RepID=UPI002B99833F|nr:type IV pilus secretin PilQ [Dokdonella sp.]HUD42094.1 type IV pilus secretin PilQ [Dokdonella sp.]